MRCNAICRFCHWERSSATDNHQAAVDQPGLEVLQQARRNGPRRGQFAPTSSIARRFPVVDVLSAGAGCPAEPPLQLPGRNRQPGVDLQVLHQPSLAPEQQFRSSRHASETCLRRVGQQQMGPIYRGTIALHLQPLRLVGAAPALRGAAPGSAHSTGATDLAFVMTQRTTSAVWDQPPRRGVSWRDAELFIFMSSWIDEEHRGVRLACLGRGADGGDQSVSADQRDPQ